MLPKFKNLAFVDIETTGTDLIHDRIIEISVHRVENDKLVDTYTRLLNPETVLSPFITQITGITPQSLESASAFFDISKDLKEILKDCIFVAHNVRFDYGFIKSEFKRIGQNFNSPTLCTVKLSRYFYPKIVSHSLDSLITRFNFECINRHRAFDDAKVLVDFYWYLKENFPEKKLERGFKYVQKKSSLPPGLKSEKFELLPETNGVYIFYGENEIPIYIGKSKNIKNRVLNHFQNNISSNKEMELSRQIKSINTIETAGDLGASILESQLIKELNPLHNRQLRTQKELFLIKQITKQNHYSTVELEKTNEIPVSDINQIVGIFNSKRKAESFLDQVSKEYNLCPKLLGIDHSARACFSSQIGLCFGACTQKELPLKYNLRFLKAFSHHQIKKWPFNTPIIISETNPFNGLTQKYIFNNWCLLALIKSQNNDNLDDIKLFPQKFEFDIYKILQRFFKNKQNFSCIQKTTQEFLDNLLFAV